MANLVAWLRKSVTQIIDPEREQRVGDLKKLLHYEVSQQKQAFRLATFLARHPAQPGDVSLATEELYREIMTRGWSDGVLTQDEIAVAVWVARVLEIQPQRAAQINLEFGLSIFERTLAAAMSDGQITDEEVNQLAVIAAGVGKTVPDLMQHYFRSKGEDFLRAIFLKAIEDNCLTSAEWQHLLSTTAKLGLTHDQMLHAIAPQGRAFVAHVLADAKVDNRLSDYESQLLEWLLANLQLPDDFVSTVRHQVAELKVFTEAAAGRLPSIQPPANVELRAGEICHYAGPVRFFFTKRLRSGPVVESHLGTLVLTDHRLLFTSTTAAFTLNYRKVVSRNESSGGIELRTDGKKGNGTYEFRQQRDLARTILITAIGRANQTIVEQLDAAPNRHIPREVRQRVWQRYGGRCAECGATDYLEFDHIIPVAKGGGNSDNNVQLLCRKCNLKKLDHI
ncbi:MAG: HNH endonuclease [Planctomycetia bacterium]|nr:HNH endonuclease [Planctomycetia bacterium]